MSDKSSEGRERLGSWPNWVGSKGAGSSTKRYGYRPDLISQESVPYWCPLCIFFYLKKAIVVTVVLCSDMQPFYSLVLEGKIRYWKYGRGDVSIVAEDSPTTHSALLPNFSTQR
jgi:hypothetical protein